jgi:hypothetical protein
MKMPKTFIDELERSLATHFSKRSGVLASDPSQSSKSEGAFLVLSALRVDVDRSSRQHYVTRSIQSRSQA